MKVKTTLATAALALGIAVTPAAAQEPREQPYCGHDRAFYVSPYTGTERAEVFIEHWTVPGDQAGPDWAGVSWVHFHRINIYVWRGDHFDFSYQQVTWCNFGI